MKSGSNRRSDSNDSIKTSEVLHESVTKQATNKPKTNGATLCIVEKKAPVWNASGHSWNVVSLMPFASQMFADFRMSPYESELSTDSFKNHQPLSYLNWSSYKERRVDALALRADERRDKLRKAAVRSKYPLTRRCLNGETRLSKPQSSYSESIAVCREPPELKHLSRARKRKKTRFPK